MPVFDVEWLRDDPLGLTRKGAFDKGYLNFQPRVALTVC